MASNPFLLSASLDEEKERKDAKQDLETQVHTLRAANRDLSEALRSARKEADDLRAEFNRRVGRLRKTLRPNFDSLRALFEDLDAIPSDDTPSVAAPTPPVEASSKWESWKQKLGGKAAEFISELLIHGEMTGQQLKVATRCGQQTVYDTIAKLNKAQLLNKNGGKYSLKEL